MGLLFVEGKRADRRKIIARADVSSALIFRQDLEIRARLRPHPRHAEIINWPDEKARQKDKALAIAQTAALSFNPQRD